MGSLTFTASSARFLERNQTMEELEKLKLILEMGDNATTGLIYYVLGGLVPPALTFIFFTFLAVLFYRLARLFSNLHISPLEDWANILGTKSHGPFIEPEKRVTIKAIDAIIKREARKR